MKDLFDRLLRFRPEERGAETVEWVVVIAVLVVAVVGGLSFLGKPNETDTAAPRHAIAAPPKAGD